MFLCIVVVLSLPLLFSSIAQPGRMLNHCIQDQLGMREALQVVICSVVNVVFGMFISTCVVTFLNWTDRVMSST